MSLRQSHQENQEGISLIGTIFSVVLILLVGGGAIYGYNSLTAGDKSKVEQESTTMSVDRSLVRSTLQTDLGGASAVRSVSSDSLQIAKADGSCVEWKIMGGPEGANTLMRGASFNIPADASSGSEVTRKFQSGQFTVGPNEVLLKLDYGKNQNLSESVNTQVSSSNGGVCW